MISSILIASVHGIGLGDLRRRFRNSELDFGQMRGGNVLLQEGVKDAGIYE